MLAVSRQKKNVLAGEEENAILNNTGVSITGPISNNFEGGKNSKKKRQERIKQSKEEKKKNEQKKEEQFRETYIGNNNSSQVTTEEDDKNDATAPLVDIGKKEQTPVQPAGYVPEKSTDNIQTDIKSPINGNSDDEQSGVPKILVPEQKSDTKTNGKLPNNPGNGSITATKNTQKSKWPTVAIWTFAVAGILAGAAASAAYFAFSVSLLTTGIIAGVGVCCLVAALIIYCCNRPSNSLEGSNVEPVANGELTVS
ncbi:hypothetical protein NOX90_07050 [Wolbachia endosymbiont of Anurida maritima]|uniref:TomO hydrophobic C-terminal domain-containing protein n=1 Tax=Wolbachia endosymbiont of Anurida maritima TaxID=2850562 RepID=UPI0035D103A3